MAFVIPMFAAIGSALGATGATAATVGMLATTTAVSTVGALAGAKAQSNQLKSQAYADEYNATMLKQNAEVASAESNQREELQRRQFGQMQGQALAGVAQSGAGFGGSNFDVLQQNAVNAEMDALNIRYEGQNRARGLLAQSQLETFQSKAHRAAARDTMTAGFINAGSNLLSGATKAYGVSKGINLAGMG